MAILERIRCTKCGAEFEEIDESSPFMRCTRIGCGATFVISQAKEFAKAEIDHTRDIRNLRQLLSEAVLHNDLNALETCAQNIRTWVPQDYFAGFCTALLKKKHGRFRTYTDFLMASHEMTPEERDQVFEIMLSHAHFTMHDEAAVHTFISLNYPLSQQKEKTQELTKAIDRLTEEQDLLSHIPRDIFICHSSSDAQIAMEAYETLQSDGNSCWISYKNLPQDQPDYWKEIETAIQNCKIILVISSRQCMNRQDPVREMELARTYGLKRLELKIDDSEHTKFFAHFFDGIQWIRRTGSNEEVYDMLRERVCLLLHETVAEKENVKPQTMVPDTQQKVIQKPVPMQGTQVPAGIGGETGSRNGPALADKAPAVPSPAVSAVIDKAAPTSLHAGSVPAAAAQGQQKAMSEAGPEKNEPEAALYGKTAVTNTPPQPSSMHEHTSKEDKTKKKRRGNSILSVFHRRLGRFLSCTLIFAWVLLILINFLGLYNVLDDWQREMPVLKNIYVTGGELYEDYIESADFVKSANMVEFLALAGALLILVVSLPFGPLQIYRSASKLTFWLVLLFSYDIYYYLSKSAVIKRAILQDKIILMAGYLLHIIIALAVCHMVRLIFRKAALKQAAGR